VRLTHKWVSESKNAAAQVARRVIHLLFKPRSSLVQAGVAGNCRPKRLEMVEEGSEMGVLRRVQAEELDLTFDGYRIFTAQRNRDLRLA